MITVPLWLFASSLGASGLFAILWARRVVLGERLVDRVLERELGHADVAVARHRAMRERR